MNYKKIILTGDLKLISKIAEKLCEDHAIFFIENVEDTANNIKIPLALVQTNFIRNIVNDSENLIILLLNSKIDDIDEKEIDTKYLYKIKCSNPEDTVELIWSLWEYRNAGGVLSKRLIQLMINCGMLLENADIGKIEGASYDLAVGDEYYCGGKIKTLSTKEPFILIEPYDYAIVTSKENANLPRDVVGRFDLSVGLFCQGVILSNGPQVDPGFRGKLFCLLFNTSNSPVILKRGEHYATLEFHKLFEPTAAYLGKHQEKYEIIYYLPSTTLQGGINQLKIELEEIKRENRNMQGYFLSIASLILAMIVILLTIR
jgi:deoxycytidine triphosphate deaminase